MCSKKFFQIVILGFVDTLMRIAQLHFHHGVDELSSRVPLGMLCRTRWATRAAASCAHQAAGEAHRLVRQGRGALSRQRGAIREGEPQDRGRCVRYRWVQGFADRLGEGVIWALDSSVYIWMYVDIFYWVGGCDGVEKFKGSDGWLKWNFLLSDKGLQM